MKKLIFTLILITSHSLMAASVASPAKMIFVSEQKTSIKIFQVNMSTDCDNTNKLAKITNGMSKHAFTYRCMNTEKLVALEIKADNESVVSFSMEKLSKFEITVPFKKTFLTIDSN